MTTRRNLELALDAAERGATVLTSNTRAARNLRREFAERKTAARNTVWSSPDILPWSAWLRRLWQENVYAAGEDCPILLDNAQQLLVWQRILGAERVSGLRPSAMAEAAVRAWGLLHEFALPTERPVFDKKVDTQAFFRWATKYQKLCDTNGWLDPAQLPVRLHETASRASQGRELVFWSFDRYSPQQQALRAALDAGGIQCRDIQLDDVPGASVRLELDDREDELRAAAAWARKKLEASPTAKIGIVVPDLDKSRGVTERIFLDTLHPEAMSVDGTSIRRAFELSVGGALSETPIVATALGLLQLTCSPVPIEAISRLLRSPYFGDVGRLDQHALLDVRLRSKSGRPEFSLDPLFEWVRDSSLCSDLLDALHALRQELRTLPSAQSPSRWSRVVLRLLRAAGWPGTRGQVSAEFQARAAFTELLSAFARLDVVAPSMQYGEVVQQLTAMAEGTVFQPENLGAPVQIVGMLEAAGSSFDHLWVMGLHADVWPPPPNPSPFLPLALQSEVTSGSSRERAGYAARVMARLLVSSPEIVFSSPRMDGDQELSPSPLIAGLSTIGREELGLNGFASYASVLLGAAETSAISDFTAPVDERAVSSGGTSIFRLQAACPFRAFAELRLDAKELELPAPGMDPRLRGLLLHLVLEYVWKELLNSNNLREQSEALLEAMVRRKVEAALTQIDLESLASWERQVAELERERLVQLTMRLLELEKQRAKEFALAGAELKEKVSLGGVAADVKVDRVDRLGNGGTVLLDYKGREMTLSGWKLPRPDEPQLPIYSTRLDDVAAIAFVEMTAGEPQFRGYARRDGILPGVKAYETLKANSKPKPTFDELLAAWRESLEAIGKEFRSGHAAVDPKKKDQTCGQCHLSLLCRVSEEPLRPQELFEMESGHE